ncbi:MAG: hypothetical protein HY804_06380 [Nitrospinae bacterium]|nr:hypothetical protein [Nitrospinota bacterium]
MRCPHCSYVSFEYLNTCRKCSKDLTAHKSALGIDFIEPISLGVLTFVATSAVKTAKAPAAVVEEEPVSSSFDTGDFVIDSGDTDEAAAVEIADTTDEVAVNLGDTGEEISLDFGGDAEDAGVSLGGAVEEAPSAVAEISLSDSEAIVSDSGFSLGLGEEGLDFGSLEVGGVEGEGISLGLDDSSPLGGIEFKMEEYSAAAPETDSGLELSLDEGVSAHSTRGDEISFDLGDAGEEISLSLDEDKPAAKTSPDATLELKPGEFDDIDISLDTKDLFGEQGAASDSDLDLGDLDLDLDSDDLKTNP